MMSKTQFDKSPPSPSSPLQPPILAGIFPSVVLLDTAEDDDAKEDEGTGKMEG